MAVALYVVMLISVGADGGPDDIERNKVTSYSKQLTLYPEIGC